jgi:chromosome segregation ATPase
MTRLERAKDPNYTVNPDAEMTMLNALDITVQDRPTASESTQEETNVGKSSMTTMEPHIEVSSHMVSHYDSIMKPLDGGETLTDEDLWTKATYMMGDLEDLGLKLKVEVESTVKSLATKQQTEHQKMAKMSQSLEEYQTEVNSLKLSISALESAADDTKLELTAILAKKNEEHAAKVAELEDKIASLDCEVQALKNENAEVKLELETARESIVAKPKSVIDTEALERLRLEVDEKNSNILQLEAQLADISKKREEQQALVDSLEDDKATLSSTLLDKDSEISDLQEKLQTLEDTYGAQIVILEKQLGDAKVALNQEAEDKETYFKQLEAMIAQHEALQEKYKAKKKETKELEQALEIAKKTTATTVSQAQLRYYQEMERKYVQAKK